MWHGHELIFLAWITSVLTIRQWCCEKVRFSVVLVFLFIRGSPCKLYTCVAICQPQVTWTWGNLSISTWGPTTQGPPPPSIMFKFVQLDVTKQWPSPRHVGEADGWLLTERPSFFISFARTRIFFSIMYNSILYYFPLSRSSFCMYSYAQIFFENDILPRFTTIGWINQLTFPDSWDFFSRNTPSWSRTLGIVRIQFPFGYAKNVSSTSVLESSKWYRKEKCTSGCIFVLYAYVMASLTGVALHPNLPNSSRWTRSFKTNSHQKIKPLTKVFVGLGDWANFVFWIIFSKIFKHQVQGICGKVHWLIKTNAGLW